MIGYLKGEIVAVDHPHMVVDVGGVGYSVIASKDVLSRKRQGNSKVTLFIYTHVREDLIQLYGFLDLPELRLFRNLISVSGIGPKTAMSVFSSGSKDSIIDAIAKGDVSFFENVPRLGKKNAQRIIIELKNKFGSVNELNLSEKDKKENSEILVALQSFGFTKKEALDGLKAIGNKGETVGEKIRLALKEMGRG